MKDGLPEKRKDVIYTHNLNAPIKAPFGVVTAFPDDPNPIVSSHGNSQESLASSYNASSCSTTKLKSCTTKTVSAAIQTEPKSFNPQSDTQLTKSLWKTEFAITQVEQQNKDLLTKLNSLKVSLRCASLSWANAKFDADRAESKMEISKGVTSDLFEMNNEEKQQLGEATSKGETL